jgi:hydroxyethylthiazole kinase-like uncharacterized protein yjeF
MLDIASISFADINNPLPPRPQDAHKGMFGHVVVIGGDFGMPGAVRIAAEGALRVGAGCVTVLTRPEHITSVVCGRPELLCYGVDKYFVLDKIIKRATVILLGPGLGQSKWSLDLFNQVINLKIPKVLDADGLNLLANQNYKSDNWILTPHPGEAARLLGISPGNVQDSRIDTLQNIHKKYGGVIVLKGHETLVGADKIIKCVTGNPAMASAGMGDLLSGIITGLVAQGLNLFTAAKYGVLLHGEAGDKAVAKFKTTSVLAMDLLGMLT